MSFKLRLFLSLVTLRYAKQFHLELGVQTNPKFVAPYNLSVMVLYPV